MVGEKMRMKLVKLDCRKIAPNPLQPRRSFDPEKLRELADSISENGLLQPVTVRRVAEGYQLVCGERRLRATRLAGITEIPAVIVDADPAKGGLLALIENLQRQELNCFEQAEGISQLIAQYGCTQSDAAQMLGFSQPAVANKLRLLCYSEEDRAKIIAAGLTERHARALLVIKREELRSEALDAVISRELTVAETEKLAARLCEGKESDRKRVSGALRDLRAFDNTLKAALRTLRVCGLKTKISCCDREDCTEYLITISK